MSRRDQDDETFFSFAPEGLPTLRPERHWGRWVAVAAVLAALAGVALYFHRNPLDAPEWLQETKLLPKPAPTVVYKWRDQAGAWHITDAPPPEGTTFERLEYQHDTNVLPLPPQLQPKD